MPLEQDILVKYSLKNSVIYDIGANAGYYAIIAAREVGESGHVYAFEPTPSMANRIHENAEKNAFNNVTVIEAAVSSIDGKINFGIAEDSISSSIRGADSENSLLVTSLRLDTFVRSNRPPNLLLVDIEGAELDALESGLELITQYRPVIMVEVHWLGQSFTDFITKHILPLGYKVTTYDGKALPDEVTRYHALLVPEPR